MTWLSASPDEPIGVDQVPAVVRSASQATGPMRERRRQVADELYQALVHGGYSFWQHIYPLFLNRDITRHDLRELLRHGLSVTRGSYRSVLELFSIPASDYKRFMNFLATHDCRVDYREFRTMKGGAPRARRSILNLLPPLDEPKTGSAASPQPDTRPREAPRDDAAELPTF
jgi:hypothetical protein